jgi:inosine-uridine nucleoside N-ribohydrolase
MSRVVAVALAAVLSLVGAGPVHAEPLPAADSCVLVDTDFDIDDMMAIPAVIGARHVAAVVTTDGYTLATLGASGVSRLIAEPGQRSIPVIVGAGIDRPEADIAETFGDHVPVYRAIMNRLNNFLPTELPPAPVQHDYVQQVVDSVAGCRDVDVLVLGPFTSFVNYSPAIRDKIGRVVITGRPLEGDPEVEAGEAFNCGYDLPSCERVFHEQLPGLDHTFVDVARDENCDKTPNKSGCVGKVYGPTLAMARALGPVGLPNTLKQIMLNDPGPWAVDTWEQAGYGGRTLFWDQSTALALLDPSLFRPVGSHLETVLSPADFQQKWAEFTNLAANFA